MERYQIAYDELKNYIAKFLKSGEKEHYNSNTEYRKYWDALQNAIFESNNDRVTTVDISGMFLKSLASELSKNEIITADQNERLLERVKDKPDYSIESDELSSQDLYLWRAYIFALDDDICKFYFWHCKNQSYVKAEMISACLKKRDFVRAEFLTDMLIKTSQKDDFELDVKLYGSWALELTRVIKELVERFDRANSHNLSKDTITDEQVDNVVKIITDIIACLPQKMQDGMQKKLSILTPKKDSDEDLDIIDLQIFEDVAYIMARHADPEMPEKTADDWLDTFNMFSVYAILPHILELWAMNTKQTSQSKKK